MSDAVATRSTLTLSDAELFELTRHRQPSQQLAPSGLVRLCACIALHSQTAKIAGRFEEWRLMRVHQIHAPGHREWIGAETVATWPGSVVTLESVLKCGGVDGHAA